MLGHLPTALRVSCYLQKQHSIDRDSTGSDRPRDRFAHDKMWPDPGYACCRGTWSLSSFPSPIIVPGQFAHRCVFCKSESRFRNCSVVPELSAHVRPTESVFRCARRWTRLPKYRLASPTSCREPRRLRPGVTDESVLGQGGSPYVERPRVSEIIAARWIFIGTIVLFLIPTRMTALSRSSFRNAPDVKPLDLRIVYRVPANCEELYMDRPPDVSLIYGCPIENRALNIPLPRFLISTD